MPKTTSFTYPSSKQFFAIAFLYSFFMAIFFQKIVLPMWPEMHAGFGLLKNDAFVFHNAAIELAQKIKTHGWSEWSLYPPGHTGNVAILAGIYSIFGPNPVYFLPLLCLLHALSALLIYKIASIFAKGDIGKIAGLVASICFLAFPSTFQWYAQNHKDSFAIAGILVILHAWLILMTEYELSWKKILFFWMQGILGTLLLGAVRPFFVLFIMVGLLFSLLTITIIDTISRNKLKHLSKQTLNLGGFILVLTTLGLGFTHVGSAERIYNESNIFADTTSIKFEWQPNPNIPTFIEEKIRKMALLRVHYVDYGQSVGAGSDIDTNRLPNSTLEFFKYLPRASAVGLFAPFPNTWQERVTAVRLVGAIETAIWYLFFLGAFITFANKINRSIIACVAFSLPIIALLAFINPNIGTLYRQRYVFWHLFLLIGAIGWSTLLINFLKKYKTQPLASSISASNQTEHHSKAGHIVASSFIVILITTVCFLGFFARDLLLIGHFGMGSQLDAFFTAAMIPMFFVTCISMPMGDALVRPFIQNGAENPEVKQQLLSNTLGWGSTLLAILTGLIILFASQSIMLILGKNVNDITLATYILCLFSPILLLSAWTIIGNAVLNSIGKQKQAAIGQMLVPTSAIIAILLSQEHALLISAALGMLAGTALNVIWVIYFTHKSGYQLIPKLGNIKRLHAITQSYYPLVFSAILPAAIVPINYAFAGSVASGTLSAWAFASKIVMLFSGMTSIIATSVLLPHFANRLHFNTKSNQTSTIHNTLFIGLAIGICFTLISFIFIEPIAATILGRNLPEVQINQLANIIKIGVLQLPVIILSMILSKQAIAANQSAIVMTCSIITFFVNIIGNLFLVTKWGVLGVAISTLAGVLSGFLCLLYFYLYKRDRFYALSH